MMPMGAATAPYLGLSITKLSNSAMTCLSSSMTTAPTVAPMISGVRGGRMPPSLPSIRRTTTKFSTIVTTRAAARSGSVGPSQSTPRPWRIRAARLAVKLVLTNDSRTSGARTRNHPAAQNRIQTTFRVLFGAPYTAWRERLAPIRCRRAVEQADGADDRGRLSGAPELLGVDPRSTHETWKRLRQGLSDVRGEPFSTQHGRHAVRQG